MIFLDAFPVTTERNELHTRARASEIEGGGQDRLRALTEQFAREFGSLPNNYSWNNQS